MAFKLESGFEKKTFVEIALTLYSGNEETKDPGTKNSDSHKPFGLYTAVDRAFAEAGLDFHMFQVIKKIMCLLFPARRGESKGRGSSEERKPPEYNS